MMRLVCQRLVRFIVYFRIKPHIPPLVRVSVNSFKFHALRRYDSGGEFNALALNTGKNPAFNSHRLRRGLPGYLIPLATHAFVPQRQICHSKSLSPLAFLLISKLFTIPLEIPLTSSILKTDSIIEPDGVEPHYLPVTYQSVYAPFTPNKTEQHSYLSYHRGCWHEISRYFILFYKDLHPS